MRIAQGWRAFFAALYALPALVLLKLAARKTRQAHELYALITATDLWVAVQQLHNELQAEVANEAQDGDNHID